MLAPSVISLITFFFSYLLDHLSTTESVKENRLRIHCFNIHCSRAGNCSGCMLVGLLCGISNTLNIYPSRMVKLLSLNSFSAGTTK